MREVHQDETSQVEIFLNSVPILASLTRDEKMMLVDALEEKSYAPASRVINQVRLWPHKTCDGNSSECIRSLHAHHCCCL